MAERVQFEDILLRTSGHGRWQWMLFVLGSISGFFNAFHHLGSVFLGGTPQHWCSSSPGPRLRAYLDERDNESTWKAQWLDYTVPKESQCNLYDRDVDSITDFLEWRNDINRTTADIGQHECSAWTYDHSQYVATIVTEWDLVCQWKALLSTVQATYMAGVFCGCFIFGMVSDRYGRRFGALISMSLFIVTGIAAAFSVHYIMFIVLRFFLATSAAGLFTCTFVLVTEVTIPSQRTLFGIFFQIPFAVGYMALPGVAYLIRDWKYLQLAIAIPNVLLIAYIWLLAESPRWLVTHGHFDRALVVLKKAAKINKHKVPPEDEVLLLFKMFKESEDSARQSKMLHKFGFGFIQDLFCRPQILKRIIIMYFTWFSVAMVYYGLALNVKNLSSDLYLVNFLNAAVEVPAYVLVLFLLEKGGRRKGYCSTFLVGGIACLTILAIPESSNAVIITLAVLGKFCVTATFAISYLFTAELFPTAVRNIAVNSSSMCGRIGSILAPFVVDLLGGYNRIIPLIIFGTVSSVAGILALFLPETNQSNMVESWVTEKSSLKQSQTSSSVINIGLSNSSSDKLSEPSTEATTQT